jgi:hypothetical protein
LKVLSQVRKNTFGDIDGRVRHRLGKLECGFFITCKDIACAPFANRRYFFGGTSGIAAPGSIRVYSEWTCHNLSRPHANQMSQLS